MGLEKDTLHVVVRLPFKRPSGFIEPPSVVWTDDMEHRLWRYMSQKHTDCKLSQTLTQLRERNNQTKRRFILIGNSIAEQLGVPKEYVVRHAAFIYETQLRGIHQHLRLSEVGKAPLSSPSTPQPPVSPSSQSQALGTSGRSNLNSRPSSRRQVPSPSRSSLNRSIVRENSLIGSSPGNTNVGSPSVENHASGSVMDPSLSEAKGRENSMMLSTLSTILPRSTGDKQAGTPEASVYKSFSSQTSRPFYSPTQSLTLDNTAEAEKAGSLPYQNIPEEQTDQDNDEDANISTDEEDQEKEDEFSNHFAKMRLELEEPAFLPRNTASQSISRHHASLSAFATNENKADDHSSSTAPTNMQLISGTSSPPRRKIFGPSQTRTASSLTNTNTVTSDDSGKETGSALNSVGSSFSDLSDSSVTQSALEDAFLSKFNNGSKM
ncbi:hypothetical protein EC973_005345 [Apophysomyces ossiformis]|uniref:Autophagy-related protein 29 n=1 Tax=Apophysomyces ossiformis TaxID=679940 RepID=A0A8H7BRU9_9FUNG|nr:hypothetical protein EC973_005345 [Apophysomyces ossiformis]